MVTRAERKPVTRELDAVSELCCVPYAWFGGRRAVIGAGLAVFVCVCAAQSYPFSWLLFVLFFLFLYIARAQDE